MKYLFSFALILFFTQAIGQQLQGKILFSRTNNNFDSLYALNQDGQTLEFITNGFRPRISRKGRYMLFSRNTGNPGASFGANMWIRDLQTQQENLLISNGDYLDYYDFSPSDREVVYSQMCNIYKVKTNGQNPYTYFGCTPCDCYSDNPKVRISDSLVVYHNVNSGLYTTPYNAFSSTKIPNTYRGDLYPVWSADGQWIAFGRSTFGAYYVPNNLYKIRPNGSDSIKLTNFTAADTLVSDPFWAYDMQSIFAIGRIAGQAGLYRISASGNQQKTLIKAFPNHISIWKYTLGLADSVKSFFTQTMDPVQREAFHLFPNPTKKDRQISLHVKQAGYYTLYSTQGKKIATGRHENPGRPLVLDAAGLHLNKGMYLVEWRDEEGIFTKKLLVE